MKAAFISHHNCHRCCRRWFDVVGHNRRHRSWISTTTSSTSGTSSTITATSFVSHRHITTGSTGSIVTAANIRGNDVFVSPFDKVVQRTHPPPQQHHHQQQQQQQQQQQRRSILSYITDLFRSNTIDRQGSNPILDILKHQIQNPVERLPVDSRRNNDHTGNDNTSTTSTNADTKESPTDPYRNFPKFSFAFLQPNHVLEAYEYVKEQQLQQLQQSMDLVTSTTTTTTTTTTTGEDKMVSLQSKLDTLIRCIDEIQQPYYTLRQISFFLFHMNHRTSMASATSTTNKRSQQQPNEWYDIIQQQQQWHNDASSSHTTTTHVTFPITSSSPSATLWQNLHSELYSTVTQMLSLQQSLLPVADATATVETVRMTDRSNLYYAAQYLINNYIRATGRQQQQLLPVVRSDTSVGGSDDTTVTKYMELSEIVQDISTSILESTESTSVSLSSVQMIYSYIGVRTEQVKLLGYNTIADQIFEIHSTNQLPMVHSHLATDINAIRHLHSDMTQRLLPILNQITDQQRRPRQPKLALESYLTSSNSMSGDDTTPSGKRSTSLSGNKYSLPQYKSDIRSMIRLEHYVTLTGALQFSFRLVQDIFGILIVECPDPSMTNDTIWDTNVRLFHCYDTLNHDVYIGSIYIDPFQREGKMSRPATIPIVTRSQHQDPIVCINLTLEVPIWDTNPAMVTWNDCETLLHELGHALQFVMAQSKYGCVLGPQSMPFDLSELLPKFMELWMTHQPSIYTLIDMSTIGRTLPLLSDEIEAAYRVKSREKVLKLAELTFYGTLELELFSNFDIQGSETILTLQERLATTILPHVDYDKNDMTALIDIVEENVRGRQVAYYRYLMCEVHAATIFEHMLYLMSTKPESVSQLRLYMRQYLLEPGAGIDYATFRSKLGLGDISIDPLWKLHQLSDTGQHGDVNELMTK